MRIKENGKALLKLNYLRQGETTLEDVLIRGIDAYYPNPNDTAGRARCIEYAKKGWFCFSTPALANSGNPKAMPVACFLSKMGDTKEDIAFTKYEIENLAYAGGGNSVDMSLVREQGADITGGGKTAGIMAQCKAVEAIVKSAQQGGSNRRGACAVYLSIHHPENETFLTMRQIQHGADANSKALELHHAINISDEFMEAMYADGLYDIICPHTNEILEQKSAREMWKKILKTMVETGEPYLFFQGNADRHMPEIYKRTGKRVTQSNLCTETLLHTDVDTTAVCVLLSVNLEYFDDWKNDGNFILDMMRLLSGMNTDFITKYQNYLTKNKSIPDYKKARLDRAYKASAMERSVGLGTMGLQYYFQSKGIAFESQEASNLNKEIYSHIRTQVDDADRILSEEWGLSPLAQEAGLQKHFSLTMAIAPTETISQLLDTSPSIEPMDANIFTKKTIAGSFTIKNHYLEKLLEEKGLNDDKTWIEIVKNQGSIQNMSIFTPEEKAIFKTAREINQLTLVQLAIDRNPYIDQGQSLNIFVNKAVTADDLHQIYSSIYKGGLVTSYYLRSEPPLTAKASEPLEKIRCDAEVCDACQ